VKPSELVTFLDDLVRNHLQISTMIWGAPGIGKSSIVQQTAQRHGIGFIDVRLSQLAPTDLRGLPVADQKAHVSRWLPPEFLPQSGAGILFLDEINLAPPIMQGMAQQLILDRRVGSYQVPEGWFIIAAGNRKEDRAAAFDMPAPLANRFIHLEIEVDLDSFKHYALERGIDEQIIAFVMFRPELLHKLAPQQPAWPSPRSWDMANLLLKNRMDVAAAIGAGAAVEFQAFRELYAQVPDLDAVLSNDSAQTWPAEPSVRYATVVGLTARAKQAKQAFHAFRWLTQHAGAEWVQLCAIDLFRQMGVKGHMRQLRKLIDGDSGIQAWLKEYGDVLSQSSAPRPSDDAPQAEPAAETAAPAA
jgi:MoxR-like ATPase